MKSWIVANWKLNHDAESALSFVRDFESEHSALFERCDIALSPPAPLIQSAAAQAEQIQVGAQNVYWEQSGAFTGELSVPLLRSVGASFALVGHSERRSLFSESIGDCAKRAASALEDDFPVIFCCGETIDDRKAGNTEEVLRAQLSPLLSDSAKFKDQAKLCIAYEPVWAIGTGEVASLEQIEQAHGFIAGLLSESLSDSSQNRILYGGSVKPENAEEILAVNHVGGALVGGASLKVSSFAGIAALAPNP